MPRQIQWLNANRYRHYPFVENSLFSTSGGIDLPTSAILDFKVVTYLNEATEVKLLKFVISNPGSGPRAGTFVFEYVDAPAGYNEFSLSVPENAAFPFKATLHDSEVHYVSCIFGAGIAELLQNTPGIYTMNYKPQIEPALISFQNQHRVLSITAVGDDNETLTGNIHVEEGYNCSISILPTRNQVWLNAIRGAGAGISCDSTNPNIVLCSDRLLRINGMRAGELGEFQIIGGRGVSVSPDPDNHRIIIKGVNNQTEIEECG